MHPLKVVGFHHRGDIFTNTYSATWSENIFENLKVWSHLFEYHRLIANSKPEDKNNFNHVSCKRLSKWTYIR